MEPDIHILGISGSLRKGSYNRILLEAAEELLPESAYLEILSIAHLPFYNEDVDRQGFPPEVVKLREHIRAADAVLITTPEYNFSISGLLKNALEWISRPPDQPLSRKPVAIAGASTGAFGTVRAQLHLRDILLGVNALVLNQPQVLITHARERFNDGRLVDEASREFYRQLLENLVENVHSLRSRSVAEDAPA